MPSVSRATAAALLAIVATAACGGGDEAVRGASAGAAGTATATDPRVPRADSSRIAGAADAPVWVVEVSDYQCPYCRQWHEQVFPVLEREFVSTGQVRFAYVHFPLPSHQHAQLAAESAMCAGAQGRFWEYHDGLFATQERWAGLADARPVFDSLAAAAGLDAAAHGECVDGGVMRGMVDADSDRMQQAGVNSTPTFFIGDQLLLGAQPIERFREAIQRATDAGATAGR